MIEKLMSIFAKIPDSNPDLDREIAERQKRMRDRMEEIKKEMGDKYILAECNKKSKLSKPRPV